MKPKVNVTKSAWGVVHKMGPDQSALATHGGGGRKRKMRKCAKIVAL